MTTLNAMAGWIGQVSLYAAVFFCGLTVFLSLIFLIKQKDQWWRMIHTSLKVQCGLMLAAVASLLFLLLQNAFEYQLVFNSVELKMPWYQKLGGLWSGQASSLLFFSLILTIAIYGTFKLGQRLPEWRMGVLAVLILSITLFVFLIPPTFVTSPFTKIWLMPNGSIANTFFAPEEAALVMPTDGRGLTPSLRHIAMLLHPPFLYLGLIGFFIPYAFSIAALIYRPDDLDWVKLVYPVALAAWMCLTLGMFLGSWWAYSIQGWGGYWSWDAVEISGLLPWLLSFGLLHSMQALLHGRPFKRWTYVFAVLIFLFVLLGILVTRSGILESVHAYSSGAMGPVLTGLLAAHAVFAGIVIGGNSKALKQPSQTSENLGPDQLLSGLNGCLLILVLLYLFGQTLPITSSLFKGAKTTFSANDYESLSTPFLLLILYFTGLFPFRYQPTRDLFPKAYRTGLTIFSIIVAAGLFLIYPISLSAALGYGLTVFLFGSWFYLLMFFVITRFRKKTSTAKLNTPLGMVLVHIGLALLAFGILGVENFTSRYEIGLQAGDSLELMGWTVNAVSREVVPAETSGGQDSNAFILQFKSASGKVIFLEPEIKSYPKLDIEESLPDFHSNLFQDVHVVMSDWNVPDSHLAEFQVSFLPSMMWIWIGGLVMVMGGLHTLRAYLIK